MTIEALTFLNSPEFQAQVGFVATASALSRLLRRLRPVNALTDALASEALSEDAVRRFVERLMADLHPGELFQHDLAIAAIAVAIEKRETDFAEEFLRDLAALQLAEMSMSVRVARECIQWRKSLASTKRSVVCVAPPAPAKTLDYRDLRAFRDMGESRRRINCGS